MYIYLYMYVYIYTCSVYICINILRNSTVYLCDSMNCRFWFDTEPYENTSHFQKDCFATET